MLTKEEVTEIFDATRPFTYQAFARAIEQAATRKAIEQCARLCDAADKSTHPSDMADALRALLPDSKEQS